MKKIIKASRICAYALLSAATISSLAMLGARSAAFAGTEDAVPVYRYSSVQDSYVTSSNKTADYGSSATVNAGSTSSVRSFVQYDLTEWYSEGKQAEALELVICPQTEITQTILTNFVISPCTQASNGWTESGLNWDTAKTLIETGDAISLTQSSVAYDEAVNEVRFTLPAEILDEYVTAEGDSRLITFRICNKSEKVSYYTKEGAAEDQTGAVFAPYLEVNRSFEVSCNSNDNSFGMVESNAAYAVVGSSVTFTITPADGYEVSEAFLNGADVTEELVAGENGVFTYTVENISAAQNFEAKFIKAGATTYNISVAQTQNGTVSSSSAVVEAGSAVTFTITPDEHYEVETCLWNGSDVKSLIKDGKLTLTPESSGELVVTFSPAEGRYTLTVTCGEGGAAYLGTEDCISVTRWASEWEEGVTLYAIPVAGYKISSVTLGGTALKLNGYSALISGQQMTEDKQIQVEFAKDENADGTQFYPVADTMISELDDSAKNTAYGNNPTADVKATATGAVRAYLLQFDISEVSDFSEVLLKIYNSYNSSGFGQYQLTLYAFTDMRIDEATSTWNSLKMDGMFTAEEGRRLSSAGTRVAVVQPDGVLPNSWTEFDVTQYIRIAKASGIINVTFLVLNSEIADKNSKTIQFQTKESNLLVEGELVRPFLSVTKSEGQLPPLPEPEYTVTVTGTEGVTLNGAEVSVATFRRYATVIVDFGKTEQGKRVAYALVNGQKAELVENKLYLNGYSEDVEVEAVLTDEYTVSVTAPEQVEVSVSSVKVAEGEGIEITFCVDAGYKVGVTVNGINYVCSDNTISLDDITEDIDVVITAVRL